MCHPFKRYCFVLAEKLKMSVANLLSTLDSKEIAEWMAYDMTCNQKWQDKYKQDKELEENRNLSWAQRAELFKKFLRGS